MKNLQVFIYYRKLFSKSFVNFINVHNNNFTIGIMEKALSSWFSSSAEYRSLYLSYIFYLRRRLNDIDIDAETKLKRIEEIRSMLEQGQKFLYYSMY